MKIAYVDKSWIQEKLTAHWHEHEINTHVKINRLISFDPHSIQVLAGILIILVLLSAPKAKSSNIRNPG